METYIALLRGINVGGSRKIKMADLREHLTAMGLTRVRTYIQSGNIVFQADKTAPEDLAVRLEEKIAEAYGFDVRVIVLTPRQLKQNLSKNPFRVVEKGDAGKVLFVFSAAKPAAPLLTALKKIEHGSEQWRFIGGLIYYHSPDGYGKAKMGNNYFEKKLNIVATSRNRNTMENLLEMAAEEV